VIGDRAYAEQPQAIAAIGRAIAEGLMAEGVMPVMKHIPGHGRAMVDSHHAAPVVTQSRAALERSDFLPFKLLADLPWAMTAHVIYQAVDPDAVLTVSARGVQEVVRGHIGFDGLLLSDDLSMQALGGSLGERAAKVLAAGCDIALHCNGEWPEMLEVAGHAGAMTERAVRRFEDSRRTVSRHRSAQGARETRKRLTELLPEWG
jgi:beta-N-acetylhexosaminidase